MEGISGTVAVVTGAAQGNGRAIAEGLARAGASVALCDNQSEAVARAANLLADAGLSTRGYTLDVSDPAACRSIATEIDRSLGPTAILVNNAGVIRRSPAGAPEFAADWAAVMRINSDGPMHMVEAFLPQLRRTGGRIVNIASIRSLTAAPGLAAYCASKGALMQFTRALAHDLAPDGVRVNAIAPGVIATPMTEATRSDPRAIGSLMAHTPLGRPGEPEELVGPVLFLASTMSSYVTGALLPVDGGYLAA